MVWKELQKNSQYRLIHNTGCNRPHTGDTGTSLDTIKYDSIQRKKGGNVYKYIFIYIYIHLYKYIFFTFGNKIYFSLDFISLIFCSFPSSISISKLHWLFSAVFSYNTVNKKARKAFQQKTQRLFKRKLKSL